MNAITSEIPNLSNTRFVRGDDGQSPSSLKTEQLLAEAKAGDKSAVNRLMDRHPDSLDRRTSFGI